jgi:hypothetical protein
MVMFHTACTKPPSAASMITRLATSGHTFQGQAVRREVRPPAMEWRDPAVPGGVKPHERLLFSG